MPAFYRLDAPAAAIMQRFGVPPGRDPWAGGPIAPGQFAPVITAGREFVAGPRQAGQPRRMVPRQWGVAEGANSVAVLEGPHLIKVLYVHGESTGIDYYAYQTIPIYAYENCTYRVVTYVSSKHGSEIRFGVVGTPTTQVGNQDCGEGVVEVEKPQAF